MKDEVKKLLKQKHRAWKTGRLSRDDFGVWLIEMNKKGEIDDETYFTYEDELDADIYANADI